MKLRVLTVLVSGGIFLAVAAPANAAYWFFNGWLPLGDGTQQVFKGPDCCQVWQRDRMSWTVGSHTMRNLGILSNGSWTGWLAPDGIYDYPIDWRVSGSNPYTAKAGCQIPAAWISYPVYTNCSFTNPP